LAGPNHGILLRSAVVAYFVVAPLPALAQARDCNAEAAYLNKAETELPKLNVAPPGDDQIVCITLETNVLFARRLAAHLQKCPRSSHARNRAMWHRTAAGYTAQFSSRGCKPAIKTYRG
jgi:hypothetical protein